MPLEKIISLLPARIRSYVSKLLESEVNKKITKGASWSIFGTFVSKGLLLLASLIVARILGSETYGEAGIIRSTVNMFTAFASMGLGLTATKYIAEYREKDFKRVLRIISLSNYVAFLSGFIFTLLIIVFSQDIAAEINAPHLDQEIKIGALMLFFNALNGVQTGILAGFEDFKSIAKNNLWAGIISFVAQVGSTLLWGLTGAIIGFAINFVTLWFFNKLSINKYIKNNRTSENRRGIKIWDKDMLAEASVLWKFSLPAVLSGMMVGPVSWLCNVILVNGKDGYHEMALFDIANQWRLTILFIPMSLSQIILPMLSSSLKDKDSYNEIFFKNLKVNAVSAFIVTLLVILITPLIVWSYGEGYNDMTLPMIIMAITTILVAVNNVIGQVIASQGRMWIGFILNLVWAAVLIIMVYLLVNHYRLGAIGMAISFLVAYLVHSLTQYLVCRKYLVY